jgi:hypothetical protein
VAFAVDERGLAAEGDRVIAQRADVRSNAVRLAAFCSNSRSVGLTTTFPSESTACGWPLM